MKEIFDRYVAEKSNKLSDAFSVAKIGLVTKIPSLDYNKVTQTQLHDSELESYTDPDPSFKLKKHYFPLEDTYLYDDKSFKTP
ncbi:hypothetical protein NPIL_138491 [Nephila pilipes]|uniref:Uncharacterized protein n=1 Tax=Nephila pilipes TaxID=299642 RepID=A0A8X6NJT5_NEPPI|nr:hypothetical protein NPIL_138491 [Nephila pilipes]